MNPADRHRGCRGKGKVKEGAPPPARRSARTNPSAAVGAVDPHLLKPPPKSIPHAPVAGMPSLVRLGDVPPERAAPPYPLRNNRTPAPDPPSVIYRKVGPPCDISLLNFRSPSLPPIHDGIPDVLIEGQELDFGQAGARGLTILLTTMSLPTMMKTLKMLLPLTTTMTMRIAITTVVYECLPP